jgi:hypothetical protein
MIVFLFKVNRGLDIPLPTNCTDCKSMLEFESNIQSMIKQVRLSLIIGLVGLISGINEMVNGIPFLLCSLVT